MFCLGVPEKELQYELSGLEKEVQKEINKVRQCPGVYIKYLSNYSFESFSFCSFSYLNKGNMRQKFQGKELILDDETRILTKESTVPVDEAINEVFSLHHFPLLTSDSWSSLGLAITCCLAWVS